jgi:hypothetical protein
MSNNDGRLGLPTNSNESAIVKQTPSVKPILFSTDMVVAIFEGRKTQTRRINGLMHNVNLINSQGDLVNLKYDKKNDLLVYSYYGYRNSRKQIKDMEKCPYGDVGDILWVRETWAKDKESILYKAGAYNFGFGTIKWKPSIHMRKEYARIFLEITDIRVQRIQEISDKDIIQEGIYFKFKEGHRIILEKFSRLWNSINKKRGYSWESNPYVWAITFKKTGMNNPAVLINNEKKTKEK